MVPSPTGAAHQLSITSAVTQDALTGSIQQAPPNDVEEPASASRLETVRASHSAGGISTRASAIRTIVQPSRRTFVRHLPTKEKGVKAYPSSPCQDI